jgi:hypothetical protein
MDDGVRIPRTPSHSTGLGECLTHEAEVIKWRRMRVGDWERVGVCADVGKS